jgi:hypothetical protein
MGQDDGIYVSARQRRRRRRKIGSAVAGAALVLGAGAYAVTTWAMGRESTAVTGLATVAPSVEALPTTPAATATSRPPASPAMVTPPRTISAAKRSWRPSPVPSPSAPTDDELAATQVSRLLLPQSPGPGIAAAAVSTTTTRNELTADGTQLRIVSAQDDLQEQWKRLGAADLGEPVGVARCTQNFQVDGAPLPQNRPGLVVCWRFSPVRSVVVIATRATGRPTPATAEAAIGREWNRV